MGRLKAERAALRQRDTFVFGMLRRREPNVLRQVANDLKTKNSPPPQILIPSLQQLHCKDKDGGRCAEAQVISGHITVRSEALERSDPAPLADWDDVWLTSQQSLESFHSISIILRLRQAEGDSVYQHSLFLCKCTDAASFLFLFQKQHLKSERSFCIL